MAEHNNDASSPGKRPTAIDVAKRAGVSRAQVSYVLNNYKLKHVSRENRKKILAAAEELGYQPHSSAQVLRRGYSKEFSIFFPAPYPPMITKVISAVHEHGLINDFTSIQYTFNSYKDIKLMYKSMHEMLNRKPYGVFCSLFDISRKDIDYMFEQGVKKILVWDISRHRDLDTICLPVKEFGKIAAEHFCSKGFRHIGFIKPSDPIQRRAYEKKLKGFTSGWNPDIPLDLEILNWPDNNYRPSLAGARDFVEGLIEKKTIPPAIYAYGDNYALPLQKALQERGIRIPRDVALLGTDNNPFTEMCTPTLSTIQFDATEMGLRVVNYMNHLISDDGTDKVFSKTLKPILIEREST